jgi:DNA-binding CsgD family transcriptional regulator
VDHDDAVAAGQAALKAGRFTDAQAAFEAALRSGETAEALDGMAEVRYWDGDYASAIDLRERAYAAFRARGETRYPAVLAAYYLAFDYAAVYGNFAAANGWLERGKRLAEISGDCAERGWVELACAVSTDDFVAKSRHVAAAADLARRFDDSDLEFDALAYEGMCLVEQGRLSEGMRKLDEAAAAARGGEVKGSTAAGEIYCKMLLACEMVLDVRRAEQWTEAANSLAGRTNIAWASAICRMHYGGILTAAGRWPEAEEELTASAQLYDRGYRALRSGALVRLAELRVRQGRLEEAHHLLAEFQDDASAVRPLARLHLAYGEVDQAAAMLHRYLDHQTDSVTTAQELALLVDAELMRSRDAEAAKIAGRLVALATRSPVPVLRGLAEYAVGVTDRGQAAAAHLEAARDQFAAAGLPWEEARTRLRLVSWYAELSPDLAVWEARAALARFEQLGASADADAAAAFLRTKGVRGRTGPKDAGVLSRREREVLALLALGLSNPEIADRLYISRKTAAHHVSAVLTKLGLRNRAEAAAYGASHPQQDPHQP